MPKNKKLNSYYSNFGQDTNEKKEKRYKSKNDRERKDRIKQKKIEDKLDLEDEVVIQMTNRNNIEKEQRRISKEMRQQKKKQRKKRRLKFICSIFLFLGFLIGSITFTMTSPIFNIKEIKVLNNKIVNSEEIISLSQIQVGENLFKFTKKTVKHNIKENAYIQDLKIKRKIPNIIEIDIIEREPKYAIEFMGKYAYINTQGYILEIAEESKELPVIIGVNTDEEQMIPNNRLNNIDLIALEDIIKITNVASESNLSQNITSISILDKNNYSIYINEEKKTIYLGDMTNLGNKILNAIAIIEKEKGNEGYIYVNGDFNNKFKPYFRKKV